MAYVGPSLYENLRENVSPELAGLPDRQLRDALAERNIDAEAMEGFFDDLGKFAARAAPAILPIAGQVVGGIYGGPAGAAIGGQLGQLAGGAISSATGQRPSGALPSRPPALSPSAPVARPPMVAAAPPAMTGGPASAPDPSGAAPVPIDPGAGSPAAGQLLQTITRPETLQALASMALGSTGRSDIPIGGTSVPVSAFTNLIGVLAGQADSEYAESVARAEAALPEYMVGASGQARGDPAIEEHRAGALYEFLSEQDAYGESEGASFESEGVESEGVESEADAAELVELAYELSEWEAE
jgi:hypothetical protein